MRPIAVDIRKRIVAAVANGESRASIARRFRVSRQTVYNLMKTDVEVLETAERGDRKEPASQEKLTPGILYLMRTWLEEEGSLTLKQLQLRLRDELGITVSHVAIWKRLKAMRLFPKKLRAPQHANAC